MDVHVLSIPATHTCRVGLVSKKLHSANDAMFAESSHASIDNIAAKKSIRHGYRDSPCQMRRVVVIIAGLLPA